MQKDNNVKDKLSVQKPQIEARTYQEDSTPEEIAMLKERVYMYDENIIFYDEIPVVCPFNINLFFQKAEDLADELDQPGLIIDVSGVTHPNAETRKVINKRFKMICDKVSHVAFVTGKNVLMNTTIRFVMFGTDLKSFSVHKNSVEAVAKIKEKLNGK